MLTHYKMYWEHINIKESVFHYDAIIGNKEYKFKLYKTRKEQLNGTKV